MVGRCYPAGAEVTLRLDAYSDDFEQEKNEDDGEDKADAASAVVSKAGSHTIAAKPEEKNQDDDDQKNHGFAYSFEGLCLLMVG
jgi:hypothetical protein